MAHLTDKVFKLLEVIMAASLAVMVVMVFGNAVLRKLSDYDIVLFGGGIPVSEELSRIVFVWLTFVGAVVVARQNAHLGVETLVAKFGTRGRTISMLLSDIIVVICCAVFFWGTWRQAPIHINNTAPITGMSMIWVYGFGFFASIGLGLLSVARIYRTLTGRLDPAELQQFAGEYNLDLAHSPKGHID
jgi:TRAP-type C4-dicarboxylate transport system permease small subunit